jgi:4-amino-4-deoxy-L-arabinose transferase-like glycosyltransferase
LTRRLLLSVLLVAALCPYFINLGVSSIWDANEAFYVETPREMIERGDYVFPTFNYEPRLNKPVLSYWIVAAFYQVFGVTVAAERLAIALGAIVIIATAFGLAFAASPRTHAGLELNERLHHSPLVAALWAALGVAIAPRMLMFARRIFIDIYVAMFMGLTLLLFALSERFPQRRRLFLVLMYVAVGLGVLTKGPVAALLPGLVFAIYLLAHRELARVKDVMLPVGTLIVLAIVVPWYAALYARDGWTYIWSFIMGENLARYTEGVGVEPDRGPEFYLPVIFTDSFPWSLFLVAGAAWWFGDRRAAPARGDVSFRIRTLLWIWIVTIVGFFMLSRAKQDLYIFPIVPAVAALAGTFIIRADFGFERRWRTALRVTAAAIGALLAIAGAGTLYVFQSGGSVYALEGAALIGAIAVAGGGAACAIAASGRARLALFTSASALVAMQWVCVVQVLPSFERYKPVPALTAALQQHGLRPDDVVMHYEVSLPSMVFYLRRHIDMYFDVEPFLDAVKTDRRAFIIMNADAYAHLAKPLEEQFGVRTCVLHRQPTINFKLREVVARKPLPEVLLVSNRCEPNADTASR